MTSENTIVLQRDINGVQIPNGNIVTLKKGETVVLTQSLGGSFTIHAVAHGGLFRIDGNDAGALGLDPIQSDGVVSAKPIEEQVWEVLKTCYDLEIPVNIVDLGLIYGMEVSEISNGKRVAVKMTLTAPGCGMGPSIADDARRKVLALPGIVEACVEITWDPPWTPARITGEGRAMLGLED